MRAVDVGGWHSGEPSGEHSLNRVVSIRPVTQSEADLYKRVCVCGIDVVWDSLDRQSMSPDGGEDSCRNTERRAWKLIWLTDSPSSLFFLITRFLCVSAD